MCDLSAIIFSCAQIDLRISEHWAKHNIFHVKEPQQEMDTHKCYFADVDVLQCLPFFPTEKLTCCKTDVRLV